MKKRQTIRELKNKIKISEKLIIQQRQLIEALRETQQIQNTILGKSLVGYYIVSDGKFRFVNPLFISYTGYSSGELIGNDADFLIHPDDIREVKKNAQSMLAGTLSSPYEFRIVTKQKEIRWIVEAVSPVLFEGKPAILGSAMDITRKKQTEQRMTESENLYRTIFETTRTVISIVEEDKTLSLVNSEFERLTGYRKEDWEGKKKWTELVDKKDLKRLVNYHRQRRIDPDSVPKSYEYGLINSQGKVMNVLSTVSLIPGSKKYVSSVMDITELKEAEEQLIKKSENLVELNSALKVLLKQREADRVELEATLLSNVKELILPYIEKIRQSGVDKKHLVYIDLIASNLENILSPFSRTLSAKYMHLTSKEIEVANFIKAGKSSKEIANLLNVSSDCVDVHRYHIRNKLGLNNKRANLRSYLSSLS